MAINTSASFTNAERTIIEKARFYAQHDAPCAALVEKHVMPKGSRTITLNRYTDLTAAALTDGIDMTTSTSLSLGTISLTTSEYGLKVIVTDKMVRENVDSVFKNVGKQTGDAIAKYRDKLIIALWASVTTNTLGSTGTTLSASLLAAGQTILQGVPAPGDLVMVVHPYNLKDLWDDLTKHNATDFMVPWPEMADSMIRHYMAGVEKRTLVPLFRDGNIPIDGNGDCIACLFPREAFGLVTEKAWSTENERDASLRATEINVVADEGVAELVDKYAVAYTLDCAKPTS